MAGALAALSTTGRSDAPPAAGGPAPSPREEGDAWSWMPSPQAIAIAVIGMLALGVGLGSAMSEIASSAPLSTVLLEYPQHAGESSRAAQEPEEAEEEAAPAEVPAEEAAPGEAFAEAPLAQPVAESPPPEEAPEEPSLVPFNPEEAGENFLEEEEAEGSLPEIEHVFLIVLGEGGYEETFGATSTAPYLSKVLPKKGELIPNYYAVAGGVLANEIAMLSGQGPTAETAADCPDYTAITPATVSVFAEQIEGEGCVYPETVESLPTQLGAAQLGWRAYVEDMENGGALGQPYRCRRPAPGGADGSGTPSPGDQYVTWRNPVVYFGAIAAGGECERVDVGFELLTHDLRTARQTPALSLIFPDACHAGGEYECEPGAPRGAQGVAALLKTLVPAILHSPAYEEGGLIAITSAEAPQEGENADPGACCLAPEYPNLPASPGPAQESTAAPRGPSDSPTGPAAEASQRESATRAAPTAEGESPPTAAESTAAYDRESVRESGGGGKVGLLLISPFLEAGRVEEAAYANHFTLLKTLEEIFGVEPLGYAGEEAMPALDPSLFTAPRSAAESPVPATRSRGTSESSAR